MRKISIAVVAILLMAVTASGEEKAPPAKGITINLKGAPSPEEQARIKAGLIAFMASCEPLFRQYWSDVVKAEAYQGDPTENYTGKRYGWDREFWIEVKITEQPRRIPAEMRAAGHTLMWVAGTGQRPGLIAKKDQAAAVCGMPVSGNGSDVFKPDPGFTVLANR